MTHAIVDFLIFDRTMQDIIDKTSKGYYNVSDLERIRDAILYVRQRLNDLSYGLPEMEVNGLELNYLTVIDKPLMQRYLNDIQKLRNALDYVGYLPQPPANFKHYGPDEANFVEKLIYDINTVVNNIYASIVRSNSYMAISGSLVWFTSDYVTPRNWADIDMEKVTWKKLNQLGISWDNLSYGVLK